MSLRETRPETTEQLGIAATFRAFGKLLATRGFVAHYLVYSFTSGAAFAFITVGAALYERLFGMTPAGFGAFWTALALAYALGAGIAGMLTQRLGVRRVLLAGTALALGGGTSFLLLALSGRTAVVPLAVALAAQPIGNGIVSPLTLAGAVNERPLLAGTASGLSSVLAMLVSMLFAIAAGALFDGSTTRIAWLLAAGTLFAMFAAMAATRRPTAT